VDENGVGVFGFVGLVVRMGMDNIEHVSVLDLDEDESTISNSIRWTKFWSTHDINGCYKKLNMAFNSRFFEDYGALKSGYQLPVIRF
jgi:hypothetical protein